MCGSQVGNIASEIDDHGLFQHFVRPPACTLPLQLPALQPPFRCVQCRDRSLTGSLSPTGGQVPVMLLCTVSQGGRGVPSPPPPPPPFLGMYAPYSLVLRPARPRAAQDRHAGYGFVTFREKSDGEKACEDGGNMLGSRTLRVTWAKSVTQASGADRGRGNIPQFWSERYIMAPNMLVEPFASCNACSSSQVAATARAHHMRRQCRFRRTLTRSPHRARHPTQR